MVLTNHRINREPFGFELLGTKRPRPTGLNVENARDYVGSFDFGDGGSADITEGNGRLFVRFAGERRIILRRLEEDRFAIRGGPSEIAFERDSSGAVDALNFNINGSDSRAEKTD